MRPDFHKVVVERPRVQVICKGRQQEVYRDIEDIPPGGKEGMKYRYRRNQKQFNENLNPLRRFLNSRVGQKWNDVWSEISRAFRSGGTLQDHIRMHVFDFVEIHAKRTEDGRVMVLKRFSHEGYIPVDEAGTSLYVHPVTGILTRAVPKITARQQHKLKQIERAKVFRKLDDRTVLVKWRDRLWYKIQLAPLPEKFMLYEVERKFNWEERTRKVFNQEFDVLFKQYFRRKDYVETDLRSQYYGSLDVYAQFKWPLNKKWLKKYGLKNG